MFRTVLSAAVLMATVGVGEPSAPAEPGRPKPAGSTSAVARVFEGPAGAESGIAFFRHDDLASHRADLGGPYLPFLETNSFRGGLYALDSGATDGQSPHGQDEIYVVMRGKAVLVAGDERTPVEPGSVAFVAAGIDHRFVDIEEDLSVLVFFAGP